VKRVFADTSFYIALVRPEDENHVSSFEFDRHFDGQYITSEFVLIELGQLAGRSSKPRGISGNPPGASFRPAHCDSSSHARMGGARTIPIRPTLG